MEFTPVYNGRKTGFKDCPYGQPNPGSPGILVLALPYLEAEEAEDIRQGIMSFALSIETSSKRKQASSSSKQNVLAPMHNDNEEDDKAEKSSLLGKSDCVENCISIGDQASHSKYAPSDTMACPLEPQQTFLSSFCERGGWLVGLLILQSCSSFILESNQKLITQHPTIIYFLTMLVGAGGNCGNQASVRMIRGIALGTVNSKTVSHILFREFIMALSIATLLAVICFGRAFLSSDCSVSESVTITLALVMIVIISIIVGSILPLLLQFVKIDPAHASTLIQVVMDISGVAITCLVATVLLETPVGKVFLIQTGLWD